MVIYKYPVPMVGSFFTLELPLGAKILAFQVQAGNPMLWALVDPHHIHKETRHFTIRNTGTPMNDWRYTDTYIGTIQIPPFVWHLFETKE